MHVSIRNLLLLCFILAYSLHIAGCDDDLSRLSNNEANELNKIQTQLVPGEIWEPTGYNTKTFPPAPPYIPAPLYACSEKVLVAGCVENAVVTLYVEGNSPNIYTAIADTSGKAEFTVQPLEVDDYL